MIAYLLLGIVLGVAGTWLVAESVEGWQRHVARKRRRWVNGNNRRRYDRRMH